MKLSINDILNSVVWKICPYGPQQNSDSFYRLFNFQEKASIPEESVKTSATINPFTDTFKLIRKPV